MTSPAARSPANLDSPLSSPVPLAAATRPDPIVEAAISPDPATPASPAPAAASPAAIPAAAPPAANPVAASPGNVRSIGVAVGAPVTPSAALSAWQGLAAKIGILLVGTSPLLADDPAGGDGKVLVAGPLPDIATAGKLCADVDRAGITCTPMPYVGSPLQPGDN
jgi:2-oxoglutarate dehydrogenase E2 component (dihydrolipoamide succinyltransferase)